MPRCTVMTILLLTFACAGGAGPAAEAGGKRPVHELKCKGTLQVCGRAAELSCQQKYGSREYEIVDTSRQNAEAIILVACGP